MADDQGTDVFTCWGPTVNNNVVGLFTSASGLTPVSGLPLGVGLEEISLAMILPVRNAYAGTIFEVAPIDFIDPDPQIISHDVEEDGTANFKGEAGPTDAPFVTIRWEVDMQPSIRFCLIEKQNELMTTRRTIEDTIILPSTVSLKGGVVRLVVIPQTDLLVVS